MPTAYDISLDHRFDASPAVVFDGFLDMYGPDRPDWIVDSRLDLRVGGHWDVTFRPPGVPEFHEHRTLTDVDRPNTLAYQAAINSPAGEFQTAVTLEFRLDDDGTRLVFTQRGFPTAQQRDEFEGAWPSVFAQLAQRLTPPG
jgi:uncharacterized protein YndB with AHSA1/START domain